MLAVACCGAITGPWVGRFVRRQFRYFAPSHTLPFEERRVDPKLVQAVENGDLPDVVRQLNAGASPDSVSSDKDGQGETVLSIAAGSGSLPMVKLLVQRGADINATDFWGGNAVTSAATWGNDEVVRFLVDHGADVNADDDGATALGYAENQQREAKTDLERRRFQRIIDILEEAGAKDGLFGLW